MAKKYDLAVKVGTYEKDGNTKNKYQNVGVIMETHDGGQFMMIDPKFNFAAVERGTDNNGNLRALVMVSMFEPKDKPLSKSSGNTPEFEE